MNCPTCGRPHEACQAEAAKERNEAAEKRRLSQARANLKRRMDEIERGNEDTCE